MNMKLLFMISIHQQTGNEIIITYQAEAAILGKEEMLQERINSQILGVKELIVFVVSPLWCYFLRDRPDLFWSVQQKQQNICR